MHNRLRLYWEYNFDILYDSGVDRFRRQFAHLEEGTAKGEKPSPQLRQNVSLPRLSSELPFPFIFENFMLFPENLLFGSGQWCCNRLGICSLHRHIH
jgi:hypothetical protein